MSDEKVVVNADEYAAMRKELVRLYQELQRARFGYRNILEFRKLPTGGRYGALTRDELEAAIEERTEALESCPLAAKWSEEEGGNG